MYGRNNAEKLSLSTARNGDFNNAISITIINNDKFGKTLSSIFSSIICYRMELSKCPPLVNHDPSGQPIFHTPPQSVHRDQPGLQGWLWQTDRRPSVKMAAWYDSSWSFLLRVSRQAKWTHATPIQVADQCITQTFWNYRVIPNKHQPVAPVK